MVSPRYASHVLGTGPIVIEVWLDYICPFSKKIFDSIYDNVAKTAEEKYPGKFQWVFQHQLQPWHAQGTWLHEAAIAVGLLEPTKFWEFSKQLFAQSRNFYDEPILDKSRTAILAEVASIAAEVGINEKKLLQVLNIDSTEVKNKGSEVINDVKYFVKIGRQNGIHVSPTVAISGLIDNEISSSYTLDQWLAKLEKTLEASTANI